MEPTSTAMSGMDIVSNVVPALMIVIGAPLGIWMWTRRRHNGTTSRLRITEKAALGRSLWVAVVEVDDKRYLVGAGEGSVGLISELGSSPVESAEAESAPSEVVSDDDPLSILSNGITQRPRMGLVSRLQQMTLRTSQRPSVRPFNASRR